MDGLLVPLFYVQCQIFGYIARDFTFLSLVDAFYLLSTSPHHKELFYDKSKQELNQFGNLLVMAVTLIAKLGCFRKCWF